MTVPSAGMRACLPTALILPSTMTTVWSASTPSVASGTTLTCTNAKGAEAAAALASVARPSARVTNKQAMVMRCCGWRGCAVGRLPRMFGPTPLGRSGRPATRRLEAANCGWRAPTYGQVLLLDDFVAHRAEGPRLELPRCKHPGPPARPWRREAGPPTPRADQPCPGRIQRARVPNSATTSMGLAT